MIEIVFFDAGDTLLRPHPSFEELFSRAVQEWGHEVSPEKVGEVRARLAPHLVDIAEETGVQNPSLSAEDSRTFWSYLYRRFLEELSIDDAALVARLFEVFSSSASYRLYDDVTPALVGVKGAGLRLGLISNFESWLEDMLIEMELGGVFDPSIISGNEGIEKPDPELYRIAIDRAGVQAARAVHVGDSPAMDIAPAMEVGMHAVLLDRTGRYPDAPGHRITSLDQLGTLIASL